MSAILSHGFRPFFWCGAVFAAMVIPIWVGFFLGLVDVQTPFPAIDWHIHEIIFGYVGAVLAGFLFTAVPNWTGRMPIRGWPLAALAILWALGRLVLGFGDGMSPWLVGVVDCGFLVVLAGVIAVEIIAGRNWRNLMVLGPVSVLALTNVGFHAEVAVTGDADVTRRLGLAVVLFLIVLIGGRIIPSFTRNWLAKNAPGPMPVPFNRFDKLTLLGSIVAFGTWVAAPAHIMAAGLLGLAGLTHILRLSRWQGWRGAPSMLLLMLHLAYGFVPLGALAMAVGIFTDNGAIQIAALHLWGIGAVGGMTLAVMMRASLGHTGRPLASGLWLGAAFIALVCATIARVILGGSELGLTVSAALWVVAFGAYCVIIGPKLWRQNPARRRANPARPAA